MLDFFKKTLYLWLSIICFGIAIGLLYVLTDFFAQGGGFIRVKGLIAPAVFAIFGLWALFSFIKKSIVEKNFVTLVVSLLLIVVAGCGVWYFSSAEYGKSRLLEKIQNDSISEEECMSEITEMLNNSDSDIDPDVIECLRALAEKGSSQAWFKLGELYYEQSDYEDAEQAFTQVCIIAEPKEVKGNDYRQIGHDLSLAYEYLGNIYNEGLTGDINKQKALMYYERAIQYPFNLHSAQIQSAIDAIKELDVATVQ